MQIPESKVAEFETALRALRRVKIDSKERWLDSLGLTEGQMYTLVALAQNPGQTTGSIARDLGVSASASTQTVETLVRRGFIRRVEDSSDRRVTHLELTPAGIEQARAIKDSRHQYCTRLMSEIPPEDVDIVIRALNILTQVIAQHQNQKGTARHDQEQ